MIRVEKDSHFYADLDMIKQLLVSMKVGVKNIDVDYIIKGINNTVERGGKLISVSKGVKK